jgi:hypothetical protein
MDSMRIMLALIGVVGAAVSAPVPQALRSSLTLHASFDKGVEADVARGDKRLFHAADYKQIDAAQPGLGDVDAALEKASGVMGSGALRFRSKNTRALFFRGQQHVAPAGGTISFWLRLDPQKDLEPGFSDPIQITDKAYNDSAIWVDFTKDEVPRHFRLGVFGELKAWNPGNQNPDKNPDFARRLVVVERPPFTREAWTHVVIAWSKLGSEQGADALYLNGKLISNRSEIREPFVWDAAKVAIRLGVNYAGLMDELAVFDRTLNADEVKMLFNASQGK